MKRCAKHFAGVKRGDPTASSAAILKVVDTENPPLRLLLRATGVTMIPGVYESRLKSWAEWADVSRVADGA